ncbi:MAG: isochorismate synthase [Paludibacter sp.]|nr:isochorismate synthase [Paludibacter sp.]
MQENNKTYFQLNKLHKTLIAQNIPFVSYRLPAEHKIVTLVQHTESPQPITSINNIGNESGFIIAPFIEGKSIRYFMKPDCVYFNDEIDNDSIEKLAYNKYFTGIKKLTANGLKTTSHEEFVANVEKSVEAIKVGKFHKVVLSKIRKNALPENFEAPEFFIKLCRKYPHAMVYMLQIPEVGFWAGATPEPLLVIENNTVKTVSLAGTQISTGKAIQTYEWSQKEIEEQAIVTNFVEQAIQHLGIETYHKIGPINEQAGHLIHLKTEFKFSETDIKDRIGNFLKALHPTPSVGGLPKNEALKFILANENYDRSYYTGFLGPVNLNGETNVFVNLRCLQLFDNKFVLYSGAGITASSDPEKEWLETDNKMLTMMNVVISTKL